MSKILRGDGLREHDANVTTIPETRNWLITLIMIMSEFRGANFFNCRDFFLLKKGFLIH